MRRKEAAAAVGPTSWGLGVALMGLYLLKRHYSLASPEELRWILMPTAWLVEVFTGLEFVFESGRGPTSTSAGLVITKACAGVNFLIVAIFAVLTSTLDRARNGRQVAVWCLRSVGIAYLVTLLVNALRVAVALEVGQEHTREGILLYSAALALLVTSLSAGSRVRRSILLGTPLAGYWAVTWIIPGLRGASELSGYWFHAGQICLLSAGIWSLAWLVLEAKSRRSSCRPAVCTGLHE